MSRSWTRRPTHGVRRSLDGSLQRLGLARIDVVFIHDVAQDTHGSD